MTGLCKPVVLMAITAKIYLQVQSMVNEGSTDLNLFPLPCKFSLTMIIIILEEILTQ